MLPFDFSRGPARFRGLGLALAVSAGLLAVPRLGLAADPPAALRVTRSAGATDCPDAASLGADVAHSVGRDVFDADSSATPSSTIEVAFSHGDAGYVADVTTSDGRTQGAQRIVDASPTCTTLAQAVVATIAVLTDGISTEAAPVPEPETGRPKETPRPPRAAFDPDDIPPREPLELGRAPTANRGPLRWYGWQILLADFATFATLYADGATGSGTASVVFGGVSVVGLLGNGAVIHALHRRTGAAIGSVALRLALPLVGGAIGGALAPSCAAPSGPSGSIDSALGDAIATGICQTVIKSDYIALGLFVGWFAASVIDVSALSWDHARAPRPSSGSARSLSITPFATLIHEPDRRTVPTLGVTGSF